MPYIPYQREKAVAYAQAWAFKRNPRYLNFDHLGGDCTNFVSQCILAGGAVMNWKTDVGWYYNTPRDRAAAWSSVPYLFKFLTENQSIGPRAVLLDADAIEAGDVIQLGNKAGEWYHSLLVHSRTENDLLVSAHSFDAWQRPLSSYLYFKIRFLHIIVSKL